MNKLDEITYHDPSQTEETVSEVLEACCGYVMKDLIYDLERRV